MKLADSSHDGADFEVRVDLFVDLGQVAILPQDLDECAKVELSVFCANFVALSLV